MRNAWPLFVLLFVPGLLAPQPALAQAAQGPHGIGTAAINFSDTSLAAPNVDAQIWYPATSSGSSAPVANGVFPVIAFGHGFNLNYLDYGQICGHLASHGFIVISPDVQNGFSVSHLEYARELSACLRYVQGEGANQQSVFYQHLDSLTGVCGHSMGGGASGLVPGVFPGIDAVSGFAAAETNPSAIAALGSYSGPFQAISGSQDNVAPEADNQTPMYNAVTGTNKQWLSIVGGAHCKFTDGATVCDFVSGGGSVTRPFQIRLSKRYVTAFFDYHLKGNANALTFLCGDSLQADINAGVVTSQQGYVCTVATSPSFGETACWQVAPNPVQNRMVIQGSGPYVLSDALGRSMLQGTLTDARTEIDLSGLQKGVYFLHGDVKACARVIVKE